MKLLLPLLAATILLTGCATTDKVTYDTTVRPPTTQVDVFKGTETPPRAHKIISELSYLGPREEELKAQRFFVAQARKMGGQAIIFTVVPAGEKAGGLGGAFSMSTAWVFQAKVIVYE